MCGIVGFITTQTKLGEPDRSKFLKQALIIDTLRGDDSTGVFGVEHESSFDDGSAYWFKQLGGGESFTDAKEYWENFYDVTKYRCVVGHNRAATVGAVATSTAHPFVEGPITLVHNGTLTRTSNLPMAMAGLKGVTVDSHAIAYNLAHHPVDEVVSTLHGAFALVWHDARDDSVNVVRNSKRPLHFGMNKAGNTLYFMSEGEMLALLDSRLRLNVENIYYPSEGQHLKWLPDTPLGRPITKELDLYEDSWPTTTYGGYDTSYFQDQYKYSSGVSAWYDDDDDDDVLPPKAPAHHERDNYIMVGGRMQEIPMLLQEQLLAHDVVIEDRWEFSPDQLGMNPQDTDRMYTHGEVHGLGRGIIYSISQGAANQTGQGKVWTVRIIGVKMDEDGEPWFVCRMVSSFVNPALIANSVVRRMGIKGEPTVAYDSVPGYGGGWLTEHEFYRRVADGCVMCHRPISIRDAYDLVWVKEGAICCTCDDRLYEGE
jgi:hypothetical protein